MKILVLGGTGMFGPVLISHLKKYGHKVIVHGNTGEADFNYDLVRSESAIELLRLTKPDRIINLVALTNVDTCESNPHAAYCLNVKVVENLVNAIKNYHSAHLVHFSTDQVYDSVGFKLEGEIRLTNTYALSKYAGEIPIRDIGGTILRTNFFGKGINAGRCSFSDWLIHRLKNNLETKVFRDVFFNPLSMSTLSEITSTVVDKPITGVFNVGSKGCMSKADFAFYLGRALGFDMKNFIIDDVANSKLLAYRPKNMSMDCSQFEKTYQIFLPSIESEILSAVDNG